MTCRECEQEQLLSGVVLCAILIATGFHFGRKRGQQQLLTMLDRAMRITHPNKEQ